MTPTKHCSSKGLVLLMGGIYVVRRWGGLKRYDINTKFHYDCLRNSGSIKVTTSTIWKAAVLVLLMGGVLGSMPFWWPQLPWQTYVNSKLKVCYVNSWNCPKRNLFNIRNNWYNVNKQHHRGNALTCKYLIPFNFIRKGTVVPVPN
jgi:hypothetical protein